MQPNATAFSRICTMPTEAKAVTEGDARFVVGIASSNRIDRQGEVVNQASLYRAFGAAFERNGNKGLPYLRDHWTGDVIGKVVEYKLDNERVWTKAKLLPPGKSQKADELFAILEDDIPFSQSIGFNPLVGQNGPWDWSISGDEDGEGVWHWGGADGSKDFDLLELSAVTIGANQDADLQLGKSLGLDMRRPWLETDERIFCGVKLADVTDPEERRLYDDLLTADGRLQAVRNITVHWGKEGRALSPDILDALLSPMGIMAEILRAGRVLSDSNREKVVSAMDALAAVLEADDSSAGRAPKDDEAKALTPFGEALLRAAQQQDNPTE